MKLYIYAKSGHRVGMEHLRRCSAIARSLSSCEPLLCTEDFRAATFAKNELGVKKTVGIDAIGNLPTMMERGDILIYDGGSDLSEENLEKMEDFCSHLYHVGDAIAYEVCENSFFEPVEKTRESLLFFADDDYNNWFLDFCEGSEKHDIPLLMGHYFFLNNEAKLEHSFKELIEDVDYAQSIRSSKYLLTATVQSALEPLASGNCPVYFQRQDREPEVHVHLLETYNIPVISGDNLDGLMESFCKVVDEYPQTKVLKPVDLSGIEKEILNTLQANTHIIPSMDYGIHDLY